MSPPRSLRPLLRRPALLPDESLASFLLRLEQRNFYDRPVYLRQLCLEELPVGNRESYPLGHPRHAEVYRRLAQLTGHDPAGLYAATVHPFARVLTPPGVISAVFDVVPGTTAPLLTTRSVARHLRTDQAAQFCPRCLAESAYHRLPWTLVALSTCEQHACLLVDRCPGCQQAIPIRALVAARCGQCGTDLTAAAPVDLDRCDRVGVDAQQVLRAWFLDKPLLAELGFRLPDQPANVLFRVVEGLRSSMRHLPEVWCAPATRDEDGLPHPAPRTRLRLSPAQAFAGYASAMHVIAGWPVRFHAFLRIYPRAYQVASSGRLADLGTLYSSWFARHWQHPAFQFVQEAFEQYLSDHDRDSALVGVPGGQEEMPVREEHAPALTAAAAARLLHASRDMVLQLVKTGRLREVESRGHRRAGDILLHGADIVALRRGWNEPIGLQEAAAILGLPPASIAELVGVGLLEAARDPNDSTTRTVHLAMVDRCLERVARLLGGSVPVYGTAVDLATAADLLAAAGLSVATILTFVAEGRVRAYRATADASGIGALIFLESGIRQCVDLVKQHQRWMGRQEVATRLRVRHATLMQWMQAGMLAPVLTCGRLHYFERQAVEQFLARYITLAEVANVLQVDALTVQQWVGQGRLAPVFAHDTCGCLVDRFDRTTLAAEMTEHGGEGRLRTT